MSLQLLHKFWWVWIMYIGEDRHILNIEVRQDKRITTCSPHMDKTSDLIPRLLTLGAYCEHAHGYSICVLNPPETRKVLQNLSCVTAVEVRHLVLRALCKSSDLDPIPTSLVKDCIDILITAITSIINLLLTEGSFPSHFKCAHVSPPPPFEKTLPQ